MSAEIISGKDMAAAIREEVKERVAGLKESGLTPGLAVVLVGEDPASQAYVGMKNRDATEVGIHSRQITLAEETPEALLIHLSIIAWHAPWTTSPFSSNYITSLVLLLVVVALQYVKLNPCLMPEPE